MSAARPRVVLVMVECVCADADVAALELGAEQWAQSVRYRAGVDGAQTLGASAVVVDGSLGVLADAFALAREGIMK